MLRQDGQAIMEFTFCMIIVLLMIYGTAMIFRWSGMDLAERRIAYEHSLFAGVDENYGECIEEVPFFGCVAWSPDGKEDGPLNQLEGSFYNPIKMNAVWEHEVWEQK